MRLRLSTQPVQYDGSRALRGHARGLQADARRHSDLHYAELQKSFPEGATPSLLEVAEVVRHIRRSKGMLLVEGDPDCRSAGSFFKNPVVNRERVADVGAVSGKAPPCFPAGQAAEKSNQVKVSAAWLIEQSGYSKGFARGAAGISSRHTLALINRGGATAAEILTLADEIQAAVEAKFGIRLEMEPELLGFENAAG